MIPLTYDAINVEGNSDCRFSVCFNPIYSGSVTWVDLPDSNLQYAVNNNNIVSDKNIEFGTQFSPGAFRSANAAGKTLENTLRPGRDLQGNLDEIWLVCEAIDSVEVGGTQTLRDLI